MSEKPTKGQVIFNAIVTVVCIVVFCAPICMMLSNYRSYCIAERQWKETERIEQEKTMKAIERYNKTMKENRKITYEDTQKDLNKLILLQKEIEKEKMKLDRSK